MKTTCDVIRDLLPLYCDGVCSQESKQLIEAHLGECDACRAQCDLMRRQLSARAVHTPQQAAAQAAAAWREGIRRAVRRAYLILLAVVVAAAAAVCLYHGLNSTAEGSILGMTAQAEKFLNTENSELVLAKKRGDYLVVMLRTEDGGCSMDILERDSLFHDRWQGGPGSAGQPAGGLSGHLFGGSDEMPLLVIYGLDLPEEACWYTFRYGDTTYTRPIVSHRVLDLFFPDNRVGGSAGAIHNITLLDGNMQELT